MFIKQKLILTILSLAVVSVTNASPKDDPNLIPLSSEQTDVYEPFEIYVLKNTIKKETSNKTKFDLLVTGVSTAQTTFASEQSEPISEDDKVEEYNMDQSNVIMKASMNCNTGETTIYKILSLDPETRKITETTPELSEQDHERNKLLKPIVCLK